MSFAPVLGEFKDALRAPPPPLQRGPFCACAGGTPLQGQVPLESRAPLGACADIPTPCWSSQRFLKPNSSAWHLCGRCQPTAGPGQLPPACGQRDSTCCVGPPLPLVRAAPSFALPRGFRGAAGPAGSRASACPMLTARGRHGQPSAGRAPGVQDPLHWAGPGARDSAARAPPPGFLHRPPSSRPCPWRVPGDPSNRPTVRFWFFAAGC